jgi:Cu-Zn family superoxide dismutase
MRSATVWAAAATAAILGAAAGCRGGREVAASPGAASAVLEPISGSAVRGRVAFVPMEQGGGWIRCRVEVTGAAPGVHAVHIHEKGDCSSKDGMSTGGHWNPTGKPHGKWGQPGGQFHLGDLGNMVVGADGTGVLEATSNEWTVGGTALTNVIGKAIIVHGGADDFVTQPTGNAGNRIACGVIQAGR